MCTPTATQKTIIDHFWSNKQLITNFFSHHIMLAKLHESLDLTLLVWER